MRSLVQIFMLWILIVSLPLRGIAAEIPLPCTMVHASADSAARAMECCDHEGMMMGMGQPAAHAHADADPAHQDTPCHNDSSPTHSSCRVCCACHVGVAVPPAFAVLDPVVAHFTENPVSPISSFTGWIPSRIERPPRA
jgi:hypothetical protein